MSSFSNLEHKWIPEIKYHAPDALIVLVGTKSDLRERTNEAVELNTINTYKEQCGAIAYIETSALERKNVDLCFETAVRSFIESAKVPQDSSKGPCCILL